MHDKHYRQETSANYIVVTTFKNKNLHLFLSYNFCFKTFRFVSALFNKICLYIRGMKEGIGRKEERTDRPLLWLRKYCMKEVGWPKMGLVKKIFQGGTWTKRD